MKTSHQIHLGIPHHWLFDESPDGTYRGWRVFLFLFRLTLRFRREPLGATVPRHGFSCLLHTPFGSVDWLYRDHDWYSVALRTKLTLAWGHESGFLVREGAIPYKHWWVKEFWELGMMQMYRDQAGALRRF